MQQVEMSHMGGKWDTTLIEMKWANGFELANIYHTISDSQDHS